MTVSFVLSLAALTGTPAIAPAPAAFVLQDETPLEDQIAACGDDPAKLWELAQTLKTNSKYADARKVMEKVIAIDPEHADARKGLGHQKYDGKWFKSSVELMMFRRKEEKAMREKGLVRLKDEWVPQADAPFLRMEWVKDEAGQWQDPRKLAQLEEEAKMKADGYERQDMTWISPDEFDQWDQGLFKCGEEWLTPEAADEWHAQLFRWWTVPSDHFVLASTNTRQGVEYAKIYADAIYGDLVKMYGVEPSEPPLMVILNSLQQFNTFAGGSQDQGVPPAEADGFSSLHHAFYAETFVNMSVQPPQYLGCGAGYWDYSPNLEAWGKFSIRHAAALSYAEAIDKSWDAISQFYANPSGGFQSATFWGEKKIPLWMRFGAANYVETFADDLTGGEGADPTLNRTWAFGHLKNLGGLRPLNEFFAFQRDLNDIPGSTKLIYEGGAIVCFIMMGGNADVTAKHEAWKDALRAGEGHKEAMTALQEALIANEAELKAFLGQ